MPLVPCILFITSRFMMDHQPAKPILPLPPILPPLPSPSYPVTSILLLSLPQVPLSCRSLLLWHLYFFFCPSVLICHVNTVFPFYPAASILPLPTTLLPLSNPSFYPDTSTMPLPSTQPPLPYLSLLPCHLYPASTCCPVSPTL